MDPAARAEAVLQRVAKLPAEEQQIWFRLIEQRYSWAVLVTMKPDEAQREQARVAGILHRKTVPWNDTVALLRQLDQREKAAVAHMVRVYRTQVSDNFRTLGKEFFDRQEAWFRIWSAWEKAGSLPEQQDHLMDWLAEAIRTSSKGSLGPLPADPKFGPDIELVPAALVKRLHEEQNKQVAGSQPPHRVEDVLPTPELPRRTAIASRVPDPAWSIDRATLPEEGNAARRGTVSLPSMARVPLIETPRLRSEPAAVALDPLELTSRKLTSLRAPPHDIATFALDYKAAGGEQSAAAAMAKTVVRDARTANIRGSAAVGRIAAVARCCAAGRAIACRPGDGRGAADRGLAARNRRGRRRSQTRARVERRRGGHVAARHFAT